MTGTNANQIAFAECFQSAAVKSSGDLPIKTTADRVCVNKPLCPHLYYFVVQLHLISFLGKGLENLAFTLAIVLISPSQGNQGEVSFAQHSLIEICR